MTQAMTKTELEARILTDIVKSYEPYDSLEAFGEGFADYQRRKHQNPYDGMPSKGLQAQAWDRGCEAAARYARAIGEPAL